MVSHEYKPTPDQVVHYGNSSDPNNKWVSFEWEEPTLGKQIQGEATVARAFGSTGDLSCGFWRTGPTTPGSRQDGSHNFLYSSASGDETSCVIEGTATLTVVSTGTKFKVGPGSVISSPKGLEVQWMVDGPFFKKFWCVWNGTEATANPPTDLKINHIGDDPDDWVEHRFNEPEHGDLVAGELYFIRTGGSTGTMLSGIWRSGKGFPGTQVDSRGTLTTHYSGVLGDETMFLLEGDVDVVEVKTGKRHIFKPGDIVGLTAGMPVTYIAKGPFSKKLWIISQDVSAA